MSSRRPELEDTIWRILQYGGWIAGLALAIGLVALIPASETGQQLIAQLLSSAPVDAVGVAPLQVLSGVAQGRGTAIILLGAFLLILTPVLRVFAALVYFAARRDRAFAGISTAVLALLLIGFLLGRIH